MEALYYPSREPIILFCINAASAIKQARSAPIGGSSRVCYPSADALCDQLLGWGAYDEPQHVLASSCGRECGPQTGATRDLGPPACSATSIDISPGLLAGRPWRSCGFGLTPGDLGAAIRGCRRAGRLVS
jgi:hypothetical protein